MLFLLFSPVLEKYSRVCGVPDEDLGAEQALAFIKCLRRFQVGESGYEEEFQRWKNGEIEGEK